MHLNFENVKLPRQKLRPLPPSCVVDYCPHSFCLVDKEEKERWRSDYENRYNFFFRRVIKMLSVYFYCDTFVSSIHWTVVWLPRWVHIHQVRCFLLLSFWCVPKCNWKGFNVERNPIRTAEGCIFRQLIRPVAYELCVKEQEKKAGAYIVDVDSAECCECMEWRGKISSIVTRSRGFVSLQCIIMVLSDFYMHQVIWFQLIAGIMKPLQVWSSSERDPNGWRIEERRNSALNHFQPWKFPNGFSGTTFFFDILNTFFYSILLFSKHFHSLM